MPGERLRLVNPQEYTDERGRLRVFEEGTLPFTPVRSFIISDVPKGQTRAGHAVTCDEVMIVIHGACLLTVRTAAGAEQHHLTETTGGVHVPPGAWVLLSDFELQTIVLVFASDRYDRTRHFSTYVDVDAERRGS